MNSEQNSSSSDLAAVLLSFLAGIIQLSLFIVGAAGNIIHTNNLFYNASDLPFLVLLSLIISICVVGTISFFSKNKNYVNSQPRFKLLIKFKKLFIDETIPPRIRVGKETDKKILILMVILLLISSIVFILSTIGYQLKKDILFITLKNGEILQTLTFVMIWVLTTVILFEWISDEIEKRKQYRVDYFIPNFIRTLQSHGYVHLVIKSNIIYNYTNHILNVNIQNEEKYFLVQWDGKSIIRELTQAEYCTALNPTPSAASTSVT